MHTPPSIPVRSLPRLWALGWLLFLGAPGIVSAQVPPPPRPDEFSKSTAFEYLPANYSESESESARTIGRNSLQVRKALLPIIEQASPSVVEIVGQYGSSTLGTIVSPDGLVVTKNSVLPEHFRCILSNGTEVEGKRIGIHPQNDLALLQIDADQLSPILFSGQPEGRAGRFVVSPGRDSGTVEFGMTIVAPQVFSIQQPRQKKSIDLGMIISESPETDSGQVNPGSRPLGLTVSRVSPRTVSERAGLLVGDQLQSVNGVVLSSSHHLNQVAQTIKVGQMLKMVVIRNGKSMTLTTRINSLIPRTELDRWGGGPYSDRRFGFATVIAHDTVLNPIRCGGPLVDLHGRVIGINIARSMRVATFAIPIRDIYQFIRHVRPDAKLKVDPDWKD